MGHSVAQVHRGCQDADRYDVPGAVWARRLTVMSYLALFGRAAWAVSRAGARVLTAVSGDWGAGGICRDSAV